jgi:hypothetical protein
MQRLSSRWPGVLSAGALCALALSCDRGPAEKPPAKAEPQATVAPASVAPLPPALTRPAVGTLVAIGDLHGDLDHARRVLRLAGAIDAKDAWIGGTLTVVQTGDEIDRGDDDRAILDLFERLKADAKKAGGEVIALSGNHELMNVALDFRYVTNGAWGTFPLLGDASAPPKMASDIIRAGRAAAFAPGGAYARLLSDRPFMVKVGDSVFVHGGILPKHVRYGLGKMHEEVVSWTLNGGKEPASVMAEDGPVWTRLYSSGDGGCSTLTEALGLLGAKRMVVGHTVQEQGINSACDGKVWRIDVGLSSYYKGPIQALRIEGDKVAPLKEP